MAAYPSSHTEPTTVTLTHSPFSHTVSIAATIAPFKSRLCANPSSNAAFQSPYYSQLAAFAPFYPSHSQLASAALSQSPLS